MIETRTVTIRSGESISHPAFLSRLTLLGLRLLDAAAGTRMTFEVANDLDGWGPLTYAGEVQLCMPSVGEQVPLPASLFQAWQYVRVRSGTAAHPVPQSGDVKVELYIGEGESDMLLGCSSGSGLPDGTDQGQILYWDAVGEGWVVGEIPALVTAADIGAAPVSHTHTASHITSGVLDDARLSNNVPLLDAENIFSDLNIFGALTSVQVKDQFIGLHSINIAIPENRIMLAFICSRKVDGSAPLLQFHLVYRGRTADVEIVQIYPTGGPTDVLVNADAEGIYLQNTGDNRYAVCSVLKLNG